MVKKAKKKRGRPKGPASARRDHDLRLPLTKAELAQLKRDAGDMTLADYVRTKLGLCPVTAPGDSPPFG